MSTAFFPSDVSSIPRGCPKYTPPVNSLTIIMSKLLTTSFFKVEAETRASKTSAGLKLANNSNSFLKPNKPASGLFDLSTSSHFEPPTAPNNIASEFFAFSKTVGVKGSPLAS